MLTLLDEISLIRGQIIRDIKTRYMSYIAEKKGTRNFRTNQVNIDFTINIEMPNDITINKEELKNLYSTIFCTETGSFGVYDRIEDRSKTMEQIPIEHMIYILSYIEQVYLNE